MSVPVTIVTSVYGDHGRYLPAWTEAVMALNPAPEWVLVATDQHHPLEVGGLIVFPCPWRHPQAWYQQTGAGLADTEWVLFADVDDLLFQDALAGLEDVAADVWQMGFMTDRGEQYIPPQLTAEEYLALDHNPFVGSSAIRLESFHAVGGFQDIALQDWGLWRRMAQAGMTFQSSGRAHFHYKRHPGARGETELSMAARPAHLAEMMESELAVA